MERFLTVSPELWGLWQVDGARNDTADQFGNAEPVNNERRAPVKREAPAITAVASAQSDLFGLPADY